VYVPLLAEFTYASQFPVSLIKFPLHQGGVGGPAGVDIVQHCPWMAPHTYDWIYKAPAVGVLCVNVVFLVMIMWVSTTGHSF
jgi:hypothetical protein